jgi:hypothetical protein
LGRRSHDRTPAVIAVAIAVTPGAITITFSVTLGQAVSGSQCHAANQFAVFADFNHVALSM